jgi:NAD+ synthase (glutamine-hydrolysing)
MSLKIAIAQIDPIIGDIKGNINKILDYTHRAKKENCDLIVFPELSVIGYPPRDLLFRKEFKDKIETAINVYSVMKD